MFYILYDIIPSGKVRIVNYFNKTTKKIYKSLHLRTRYLPLITSLHKMFYEDKTKIVPNNIELLTPLALSHWLMQDGAFRPNRGELLIPKRGGIVLCTDNFTAADTLRLQKHLETVLGLDCTDQKSHKDNNLRIYIKVSSLQLVRELVQKHMIASMLYKIGL